MQVHGGGSHDRFIYLLRGTIFCALSLSLSILRSAAKVKAERKSPFAIEERNLRVVVRTPECLDCLSISLSLSLYAAIPRQSRVHIFRRSIGLSSLLVLLQLRRAQSTKER